MIVEFLPEADAEFREAARYYESEAPGVGLAFVAAIHKAVAAIVEVPLVVQIVRGSIRRKVISPFPYNILYSIEAEKIVIIAVAHQRRRPNYWRSRLVR